MWRSASKAPARTVPAWRDFSLPPAATLQRSTGPTVGRAVHMASRIRSTRKLQLALCWQVVSALPRLTTIAWGMIRTLRVARRSALKMRTQAINQMKALVITAPDDLRSRLRQLTNPDLVAC